MKKNYISLVVLLLVSLVCFVALSLWPDGIDLGPLHVKTATFAETLTTPARADQPEPAAAAPPADPAPPQTDNGKKTILFIGDSMLEGLGPRMAAYATHNGHTLVNVIWYSSTTEVWGRNIPRLKELMRTYRPDYIIICLGANELFVRDIKRQRQRYVDAILNQIGNVPYVWIGPPNWKKDTGINDMLKASCAPGCYYNSYTPDQHYDRSRDGAHPTRSSAAKWCDRVCEWIMTGSAHPIQMQVPAKDKGRPKKIIMYQPVYY